MKRIFFALFLILALPVLALAQDNSSGSFDVQSFLLQLVGTGGIGMLVSGWIAAQWTKLTGVAMLIQTFLVAIALTFFASVFGMIPAGPGDIWLWLKAGIGNGVLAALLYKMGIFNGLLEALKARTTHQLEQK